MIQAEEEKLETEAQAMVDVDAAAVKKDKSFSITEIISMIVCTFLLLFYFYIVLFKL